MYRRTWLVKVVHGGYELVLLVNGTEEDLRNYLDKELLQYFDTYHYSGATEKDMEAAQVLGLKTYIV